MVIVKYCSQSLDGVTHNNCRLFMPVRVSSVLTVSNYKCSSRIPIRSRIFTSCIFMSLHLVLHFQVLHFQRPHVTSAYRS